jgi:3-hydroxyacyl-[acyl-carrier-protein] dehydratase
MILTFEDIKAILPHRFPFLFVDQVEFLTAGERIVAIKNISGNESCFLGHFPKKAIFPGVLITEAIAQAAGILLIGKEAHTYPELLLAHSDIRFFRPVVPGDQIRIEVEAGKVMKMGAIVAGKATVSGVLVAKGRLTLKINHAAINKEE